MEFDEVVMKESPGLCRCCLSEGCYKDLSTEYSWMNENEVYADMLLDCFDISISQHNEGPNGLNRLICEVCITRLRDAVNFKKQVLESEKKFVDMVGRGEFTKNIVIYEAAVKPEVEDDVEYLEEDMEYVEAEYLNEESIAEGEASEEETVEVPVRAKRGRPRKQQPEKPERKPKVAKLDEKPRSSKTMTKGATRPEGPHEGELSSKPITTTKRNRLMKRNAIIVLETSTVVPFKWHRHDYLCFYCHKPFKDIALLKTHTADKHNKSNIKSAVSYLKRDEKVKIDASEVSCRLCGSNLDNVDLFIDHIKVVHRRKLPRECGYGIIPYKLDGDCFQCAVCGETFQYFVKLNQHMNSHYGDYVCESCGKSFLSRDRLRCHALTHKTGYKCTDCDETFDSSTRRSTHESKVHNRERSLKCLFCPETFINFRLRKKHHHEAHDIEMPEYSCPVCGKVFLIMSRMEVHLKEVHVREKNFSCSMCDLKLFSRTHLKKHMIKHFGQRAFECEVCKKSYARKQTLRDHMRIHNEDRRFICPVCSQGFVQNNTLQLHIKVHHPGVVND